MVYTEEKKMVGVHIFFTHTQYPLLGRAEWIVSLKIALILIPKLGLSHFLKFHRTISVLMEKRPPTPHFYAEFIRVDPSFQRRGIYTAFMRSMIRFANKFKVGVYAETSNKINSEIVQQFGFEVIGEEIIQKTRYWFLWRKPFMNSHIF